MMLRDLDQIKVKIVKMQRDLEMGLDSLCKNKALIIRPADKVGGIVILDRCDYLAEMYRIVGDCGTYTPLNRDPVVKYKKELEGIIDRRFKWGIINKKEKLFLVPSAPRTPMIYYLPKIHKNQTCPTIVSGIDSVMSQVGKYIDYYLQPLVQLMPSYIKDTRHVINLLSNLNPKKGLRLQQMYLLYLQLSLTIWVLKQLSYIWIAILDSPDSSWILLWSYWNLRQRITTSGLVTNFTVKTGMWP